MTKISALLKRFFPNFHKTAVICINIIIIAVAIEMILLSYGGFYYKRFLSPGQTDMLPSAIFLVSLLIIRHILKRKDRVGIRQDKLVKLLNNKKWVALILLIVLVFGFYSMNRNSWNMSADSKLYYVYLRSMFFDGDLHFTNDYIKMGGPFYSMNHQTGYWNNPFAVGSSILWFPFFLTGHLYAKCLDYPTDGYAEFPYGTSINLAGLLLAWIGIVLLVSTLQKFFDDKIALSATLLIWYGTPLTFYTNQQPNLDTALSFFGGSLFLYIFFKLRERPTTQRWIALGIAAGICMLVRPQNVILLLIPGITLLQFLIKAIKQENKKNIAIIIRWGFLLAIFTTVTFLPQVLVWQIMYHSPVTIPQGDHWMEWNNPKIIQVLFSTNHGLFAWTPIFIFAVVGLVLFNKKDKWTASALLMAFAAMIFINSVPNDWWGGFAFGGRRFSSTFPILAIGFASLLKPLFEKRILKYTVIVLSVTAVLWNYAFISIFSDKTIPHQGTMKPAKLYSLVGNRAAEIVSGLPESFTDYVFMLTHKNACKECRKVSLREGVNPILIGEESLYLRNGWSIAKNDSAAGQAYRTANRNIASINFYLDSVPQNGLTINLICRSGNDTISVVPVMNSTPIQVLKLGKRWKGYNFSVGPNILQEGINLLRLDSYKANIKKPKAIMKSTVGEFVEVLRINIVMKD